MVVETLPAHLPRDPPRSSAGRPPAVFASASAPVITKTSPPRTAAAELLRAPPALRCTRLAGARGMSTECAHTLVTSQVGIAIPASMQIFPSTLTYIINFRTICRNTKRITHYE